MTSLSRTAFALCLLFSAAAADNSKPPLAPGHSRPGAGRAAPTRPVLSDALIEQQIKARFGRSKISADKFQVKVQGGVAYIDGKTDVMQHKGVATRIAKAAGAVQVVNKIQIGQAARDRALANLDKGRRREQIKRSEVANR